LAITDAGLAHLGRYAWPGNVRELKHLLEEAAVLATGGVIDVEHLAIPGSQPPPASLDVAVEALAGRLMDAHPGEVHARIVDLVEGALVRTAIARTGGNQLRAAELIGINRATLKKRLDQLGERG
jgi:DNA-binding NtrC family response regulator